MISQHANQQIQHLPIQRSPIKSQFSSNDKSLNDFERKRRPDVCVAENYIQNFITVKIPGKVTTPVSQRMVAGDSHVKQIRRIDFNKEL